MAANIEFHHHKFTKQLNIRPSDSQPKFDRSTQSGSCADGEPLYTLKEILSIPEEAIVNEAAYPFRTSINTSTETVMSETSPIGALKQSRLSRCWMVIKRKLPLRQNK
ncbi:uncharacterized protein Z519_07913 [Cladophialophora bantiana CBS 173.52]|uniref:Uncharacterized protein n=1 Tax=Cladophialophora bantiana (strain ATCC 10958 / CBS 173.52 / CDC B-1940 / NIH 8579) TaxID=1442370 RepID=A0A0D2I2F0_CLAB1|nr:uncharacterized protein Z519_07913 [Cladophialophora bantiana CBS 173.52]KIW91019.1 hypothetical protein Z519_07913 [Cladophialophora bantiana CBS 173.52]